MALPIRQNATHKVVIGPVVAVANGYVPVTTLSVATADEAEAILHDNGIVVDISGYTFAAITTADGYYHLTLQSGISGTVGHMTVVINDDSLCLPVRADFIVIEEAVYDALYAASAVGYASQASVDAIDNFVDTEIADIQSRLPAALVGGRIDASIGAAAANTITASALATDAVTEIQNGLATAAALNVVDDFLDTEIAALTTELAKVPKSDGTATWNATALASLQAEATDALNAYDPPTHAELTTALGTADDAVLAAIAALNNLSAAQVNAECDTAISDAALATAANLATVDTVVDAIKVKTDSLTFTKALELDANIQSINGVTITGNGSTGTEFGV